MRHSSAICGFVAWLVSACAGAPRQTSSAPSDSPVGPDDAPNVIAEALRSHQLVLISEHHWSVPVHEQLRRIIASPKLDGVVQDVVVEFGNPRYQGVIDRYVAGDSVPLDSLRPAWRNTTQLLVWDSPLYQQFYEAVRAVNATRPRDRQLRLVAGDPPIDWSRTSRAEDIPRSYGFRDIETMGIIEREVLAKGRRALVIIGEEHVVRVTGPGEKPLERMSLGEGLETLHPGVTFVVGTAVGNASPLARALQRRPNGSITGIVGTPLGLADASIRARDTSGRATTPPAAPGRLRLQDLVDAVLYAGPSEQIIRPPSTVYREDPEYVREIRRRIAILSAFYRVDIWSEDLDRLLQAP